MNVRNRLFRSLRVLFSVLLLGTFALPAWALSQQESADLGLSWLKSKMAEDGSLPGLAYNVSSTADGVLAIVAGNQDPNDWRTEAGASPITYLEEHAADDDSEDPEPDPREDAGLAAKVAIAAVISGADPKEFGGVDLLEFINDNYDPSTGEYSGSGGAVFTQALAMLGVASAGEIIPDNAIDYLIGLQSSTDGGWGDFGSDTNSTSLAINALVAAKAQDSIDSSSIDTSREDGMDFLESEQNDDGGFAYQKAFAANYCDGDDSNVSDANSTALSIQAIRAVGEDPKTGKWVTDEGTQPVSMLMSLQASNGSFNFQEGTNSFCTNNAYATVQAIPAVVEKSFVCLIGLGTCPASATTPSSPDPSPTPDEAPPDGSDDGSASSSTPTGSKTSSPIKKRSITAPSEPEPLPSVSPIEPDPEPETLTRTPDSPARTSEPRATENPDDQGSPAIYLAVIGALALSGLGAAAFLAWRSRT